MLLKQILAHSWPRYSFSLDMVNRLPLLVQWGRRNREMRMFANRESYFDWLCAEYVGNGPVDFLEFGVYRGESLRHWTTVNKHPNSRFFGFDTFEGLPEKWEMGPVTLRKGHFDTGGKVPDLGDTRVSFVKGRFQDTLPAFLHAFAPRSPLVIHADADLYSSTLYLLTQLDPLVAEHRALIMFDEFSSVLNEFRAFHDYLAAYDRSFVAVAAVTPTYDQQAVLVGRSPSQLGGMAESTSTR